MKEQDYIEDLIKQNIEELNNHEPSDGHFERFEALLNKQDVSKRKNTFTMVWKIAAAVVVIFLASNQALLYFSPKSEGWLPIKSKNSEITLTSISTEYNEVEFYYTNAINSGVDQWNKFNELGLISEEEQEMMRKELKEFELIYANLQEDLNTNPEDERVINALMDYYRAKLSVITIIIDKLEEVQQRREISYEII